MVTVIRATSWRAVTSLLLLSVSAAVRGTVCGGERRNRHEIASGGSGQVGNGVNSFLPIDMVGSLLVDMIGGVVSGTRGGGLQKKS